MISDTVRSVSTFGYCKVNIIDETDMYTNLLFYRNINNELDGIWVLCGTKLYSLVVSCATSKDYVDIKYDTFSGELIHVSRSKIKFTVKNIVESVIEGYKCIVTTRPLCVWLITNDYCKYSIGTTHNMSSIVWDDKMDHTIIV